MPVNSISSNQVSRVSSKAPKSKPVATPFSDVVGKKLAAKIKSEPNPVKLTGSQPAAQAASTKSAAKVSEPGETKFYQPVYLAKSVCGGYICETDLKACKELFQTGV